MQQSGGSLNVSWHCSSWNSLHYTYFCPSQPLWKKVTKATPGLTKSIQSTSREEGENIKIATDPLFLEHGHYLHQHMGLKSVIEQPYCVVTQDLLVGTALGERTCQK